MPNPPERPLPFKLEPSASGQNIKNLVGNFRAIHVRIMDANFQLSSTKGVRGG